MIDRRLALGLLVLLAGIVACPAQDQTQRSEGVPSLAGLEPAMSEAERRLRRAEVPAQEARRRARAEALLNASDAQGRLEGVALMRSDYADESASLVRLLGTDPSAVVRAQAATQLDLAEPEDALEPLMGALDDPSPEVVIASLRTIEMLADRSIIPRLRSYQRHPERRVRVAVASTIDVLE
jgi:HEAT repeat protein